MSEQSYEPDDPQLDPLEDPDLKQVDAELGSGEDDADPEALTSDTLLRDEQDDTWEPAQHLSNATAELIGLDDPDHETLDQRLAQEVPDVDATRGGALDADHEIREV